jgi:hypothetical protein
VIAGDVALAGDAGEAVLAEPGSRFPAAIEAGMTSPFMSITWHLGLMRSPARVSCTTVVAQAA